MNYVVALIAIALAGCGSPSNDERVELKEPAPKASLETFGVSATTKDMFKREGVARLQQRLNVRLAEVKKNLEDGVKDAGSSLKNAPPEELQTTGVLDEETQRALGAFQKSRGMPETGMPDYETLERLGLEPADVFHHRPPANQRGGEKS